MASRTGVQRNAQGPTTVFDVSVNGPFPIRLALSAGGELWEKDSTLYLSTFYQQFCNIIMMATFTGGVQAAILAFMNDLLANEAINADLFKPDPAKPDRPRYTPYSIGLMIGLLAVALNIGVAAISAVNAALTCHFSIYRPARRPGMEAPVLFCMIVMFVAFCLSGISLILLSSKFDLPFTIVLAVLFFTGITIAAYQFVVEFGMKWLKALFHKRLHFLSVLASTAACAVGLGRLLPSSWYTTSAYAFTLLYHVVAVLYDKSANANVRRPRRIAAFCVTLLALAWAGCVAMTMARHVQVQESRADRPLRYVLAALAGVEAVLLCAIAVRNWVEIAEDFRSSQESGEP